MTQVPLVHVVDDSAELRAALKLLLKSVSIDVRTYASADEILNLPGGLPDRPSCVLLDVRMPGMSGMALLERLRQQYPGLPIVIMTGHGDIDMAVRAMKLGAVDFVTKPFSPQALLDLVQDVLRRNCRAPRDPCKRRRRQCPLGYPHRPGAGDLRAHRLR